MTLSTIGNPPIAAFPPLADITEASPSPDIQACAHTSKCKHTWIWTQALMEMLSKKCRHRQPDICTRRKTCMHTLIYRHTIAYLSIYVNNNLQKHVSTPKSGILPPHSVWLHSVCTSTACIILYLFPIILTRIKWQSAICYWSAFGLGNPI